MGRVTHMCQSIDGPLNNWSDKDWLEATKWSSKGDGTKFKDWKELKQVYLDAHAKGWKVFPMCDCENFDYVEGCKGYEIDEND